MSNEATPQGIPVSKEFAAQLQRLAVKFQLFDLTYVELKEQVENVTKALLVRINASETEKAELRKKLIGEAEQEAKDHAEPATLALLCEAYALDLEARGKSPDSITRFDRELRHVFKNAAVERMVPGPVRPIWCAHWTGVMPWRRTIS